MSGQVSRKSKAERLPEKKIPPRKTVEKMAVEARGGHCQTCPKKKKFVLNDPPRLLGRQPTADELSVRVVCESNPDEVRRPFQGTSGVKKDQNHTFCRDFRKILHRLITGREQ